MADFLKKLGSVVGIGVGSIELLLVKRDFAPGDTIHGRLVLKLSERTEARKLMVAVEATEEHTSLTSDGRGGRVRSTSTKTLHHFEQQLDGKRLYLDEAYDFHLPLPQGPEIALPGGVLGDVARFVTAVAAATRRPPSWRVVATLDVPWKANVTTRADIVLR